jgi:2-dehydropantoate 2-reductase
MKVLIVGAGVIGTVYGASLSAAGDTVSVLRHGPRTVDIAANGLIARDVADGHVTRASVAVVADAGGEIYDLVVVAVKREQLAGAWVPLLALEGTPSILLLGNNPDGRDAVLDRLRSRVRLGFPGVGGTLVDGTAAYVRIQPQPTALEAVDDVRLDEFAAHLITRNFAVERIVHMEGWLAYHAVFVTCICSALDRSGTDTQRLAGDSNMLRLMCHALTEGFAALRRRAVGGLPRNLRILHSRLLMPIAVSYWSRTMRSANGELWFGAHARHAGAETRALSSDVLDRIGDDPLVSHLRELLRSA